MGASFVDGLFVALSIFSFRTSFKYVILAIIITAIILVIYYRYFDKKSINTN